MFYPGYHAISPHVFWRGKYTTNERYRVWAVGRFRRPIRRRNLPRFFHNPVR